MAAEKIMKNSGPILSLQFNFGKSHTDGEMEEFIRQQGNRWTVFFLKDDHIYKREFVYVIEPLRN